jgi:hypothetical protein
VTVLEAERLGGFDDRLQVLAIDGDVDIAGRTGGERMALVNSRNTATPPTTRYSTFAWASARASRSIVSKSCCTCRS